MYQKNLTEMLRLRLSEIDMDFLRKLSDERGVSISEVIRSILGEYRRSLATLDILKSALDAASRGAVHGDTETNINNFI